MNDAIDELISWGYPLVEVALIIIAVAHRRFPGKPWLLAYLSIELATSVLWRVPPEWLGLDYSEFWDVLGLPLTILGFAGFCLLIPFVLAVGGSSRHRSAQGAGVISPPGALPDLQSGAPPDGPPTGDTTHPLYGVHGWLKFFVIVNMYIAPALFGLQQLMGFIGFGVMADQYPRIVVLGLLEAGVGLFLVVKWIMIARRLQDIVPGVVQEAKQWLLITLGWNVLSTPLVFLSGMDADDLMPGTIKQLFLGIVSFAIWYSYFSVSKRVKATYPDWNE